MQDKNTVATADSRNGIVIISAGLDGLVSPYIGLTLHQDLRILMSLDRRDMYLIDKCIITRCTLRELRHGCIPYHGITHIRITAVLLRTDGLFMTGTYIMCLNLFSHCINRQVQLMVLCDRTIQAGYDMFPCAGGVVVFAVHIPNERQIGLTYPFAVRRLLYNMQDTDAVATVSQVRRIAIVSSCDNRIVAPSDGLAFVQDLRFRIGLNGTYVNLYEQGIVTRRLLCELLLNRIQINGITLHIIGAIDLAVNALLMTGTNIIGLLTRSDSINRQVQLVELCDRTVSVGLDIFPRAVGVVTVSILIPNERQFCFTYPFAVWLLLYNMQDTDAVATVCQFRRVAIFTTALNRIVAPSDGLAFVQDLRLSVLFNRYNRYVYIDYTIAYTILGVYINRVFVYLIRRIIGISIGLVMYVFRFTATYGVVLTGFRYGIDGQI